ncbi:MAG: hypothetical protein ABIF19_10305 [Planctomycetota bacterium]
MSDQTELTNQELVRLLDTYLYGWEYKQIESASVQGPAKLAGFILGACFIDAMAGFLSGIDRDSAKKGSGKRFQDFVKKYMDQYDPDKLWQDLRCGLVHSYAAGDTYAFTDNNKAGFHFELTARGKVILNLEDFCADLRKAYARFRKDILTDRTVFLNAKRRYKSMGLMMEVPHDQL